MVPFHLATQGQFGGYENAAANNQGDDKTAGIQCTKRVSEMDPQMCNVKLLAQCGGAILEVNSGR